MDTFETWYAAVEEFFSVYLDMSPEQTGWDWKTIYVSERLSPAEAFEQYVETI